MVKLRSTLIFIYNNRRVIGVIVGSFCTLFGYSDMGNLIIGASNNDL